MLIPLAEHIFLGRPTFLFSPCDLSLTNRDIYDIIQSKNFCLLDFSRKF